MRHVRFVRPVSAGKVDMVDLQLVRHALTFSPDVYWLFDRVQLSCPTRRLILDMQRRIVTQWRDDDDEHDDPYAWAD